MSHVTEAFLLTSVFVFIPYFNEILAVIFPTGPIGVLSDSEIDPIKDFSLKKSQPFTATDQSHFHFCISFERTIF